VFALLSCSLTWMRREKAVLTSLSAVCVVCVCWQAKLDGRPMSASLWQRHVSRFTKAAVTNFTTMSLPPHRIGTHTHHKRGIEGGEEERGAFFVFLGRRGVERWRVRI
jgi:hypothetical protein